MAQSFLVTEEKKMDKITSRPSIQFCNSTKVYHTSQSCANVDLLMDCNSHHFMVITKARLPTFSATRKAHVSRIPRAGRRTTETASAPRQAPTRSAA